MLFTLYVAVRDPGTGDLRELKRTFDPSLPAATLQTKWNALGPAVLALINDLLAAVNADPNAPPAF